MQKKKDIWCVYLFDNGISYTLGKPLEESNQIIGFKPIEDGAIQKGYIKDPKSIQAILKEIKKENQITNNPVRIILREANIFFKKITIDKSLVKAKDIQSYIHSQLGNTIHFPFESSVFDYQIINELPDVYEVLVSISDENLIHDYIDMFESIHSYKIEFDNAFLATYRLYHHYHDVQASDKSSQDEYAPDLEGEMNVSVYHNVLTIAIFDGFVPVFTMIEVIEDNAFDEVVIEYIERVANYYKYNIHKGEKQIAHIEIFNYHSCLGKTNFMNQLKKEVPDYEISSFDFKKIKSYQDGLCHKGFFMVHSASIK